MVLTSCLSGTPNRPSFTLASSSPGRTGGPSSYVMALASWLIELSMFRPNERILDLDWTTTADLQSVLAVGFRQNVVLLAEQRMSYVEGDGSYWAPFLQVDMAS